MSEKRNVVILIPNTGFLTLANA